MARFAPGLVGVALFALWIWAVLDVIATDRVLARNLDKMAWLFLVIFVPTVGAVAWLALGRPVNAGFRPGSTQVRTAPGTYKPAPRGLKDSDAWSARKSNVSDDGFETTAARERRLAEREAEVAKRERELNNDE